MRECGHKSEALTPRIIDRMLEAAERCFLVDVIPEQKHPALSTGLVSRAPLDLLKRLYEAHVITDNAIMARVLNRLMGLGTQAAY